MLESVFDLFYMLESVPHFEIHLKLTNVIIASTVFTRKMPQV